MFKARHTLSAVCMDDLCALLCLLKVPNAPRSWFRIKQPFDDALSSASDRRLWWVCPACKKPSENQFTCSGETCDWSFNPPAAMPNHFYTFDIIHQLSATLSTTRDIHFPKKKRNSLSAMTPMRDVVDGNRYSELVDQESCDILTLTMSTDGIQPFNSSDKSIWPVSFVVNEIDRRKRFSFECILVGGIWPGPAKPKRFEMAALLETIVKQLKHLEKGYHFEYPTASGYVTRLLKVFLICACMDKPAQAIVQNLPEPTAKFGCGRCEIRGESCDFFLMILRTMVITHRIFGAHFSEVNESDQLFSDR